MKRSRRIVLQIMGTIAVGTLAMGFTPLPYCPPGRRRRLNRCEVTYGGFGSSTRRFQFRGGG